ncbi:hypothetical protein IG631_09747 [Alternaria alternata]|nr:hypothetical protein IG631_09747 [Alternaria alternata]
MHDRPAPLPPFRSHLRDGPLLGCPDPGTHFHRFSTVLHAAMVWSERTRMNQIDERVGLQAVLTRWMVAPDLGDAGDIREGFCGGEVEKLDGVGLVF